MHRSHHSWYSPTLGRHMDLLVFGHAGARMLAFPCSNGRFWDWEERGLVGALSHHLNNGWLQLICVDTVDNESWYNYGAHPGYRAWRHELFDRYVYHEVVPFTEYINHNPYLIASGASFGGYHALNFGLKHPDKVRRIISMSGLANIRMFTDGYTNETVYVNNPVDFIPGEHDHWRLGALRSQDIIMIVGKTDRLLHSNRELSSKLWSKGIGNALREWDGFAHDWPWWAQMLQMYVNGHD